MLFFPQKALENDASSVFVKDPGELILCTVTVLYMLLLTVVWCSVVDPDPDLHGSALIRADLHPDPYRYWECGSGLRSMEIYKDKTNKPGFLPF
jgi:hypothetical protein